MARSPRRRIRLATVAGELMVLRARSGFRKTFADLTPATGASTTRFCRTRPPFEKAGRRAWYQSRRSFSEGGSRRSSCALDDRSQVNLPCDAVAPDAAASTASRSNVRDDRDTPLMRDGMRKR